MIHSSVLITGSSGFIGSRLYSGLSGEISKLDGLSRNEHCDISFDLSIGNPSLLNYEMVVHCAGKAHSNDKWSHSDYSKDIAITQNLLSSLSKTPPKCFIYLSSVSVYGITKGYMIDEHSETNPMDLYGKSKLYSEKIILDWCKNHGVSFLILRLPLVIGKSAPGNFGKLMSAIKGKRFFLISGNNALKSMVLIDDLISLIKQQLISGVTCSGIYNLTDGTQIGFNSFVIKLCESNGFSPPITLPSFFVKSLAMIGSIFPYSPFNMGTYSKMTSTLTFSSNKAENNLNWRPSAVIDNLNNLIA